jgi:TetR/AcrR family transcriptional regulator, mexJK operon transcriptional repressor
MSTEAPTRPVRDGNAAKRAAILEAARDLFLQEGVERASMDQVAARAAVSKRTVYDYFGDKQSLLLAVVEQATASMQALLREAADRALGDEAGIADVAGLERALIAFATDLGRTVIASPDYLLADRLARDDAAVLPAARRQSTHRSSQRFLAERLGRFDRLLDIPDPAVAADHFKALTISLAVADDATRRSTTSGSDLARIDRIMTDGTRAFVRAYAKRDTRRYS